jgi:hypothetical protein
MTKPVKPKTKPLMVKKRRIRSLNSERLETVMGGIVRPACSPQASTGTSVSTAF